METGAVRIDMIQNFNSNQRPVDVKGSDPVCVSFVSEISPLTTPVLNYYTWGNVNDKHDEIRFFLSIPGGSVQDGSAMYNFIKSLPVPLITYNTGQANSISNVVYQSGQRRIVCASSSFMFHGVGVNAQPHMRPGIKTLARDNQINRK